ncbi:MAG: hypothetical protein IBJ00_02275 [Alphaproteobacteria bacterium]|nr:hypothetical protein [Alphaproteobacteria bacterium]
MLYTSSNISLDSHGRSMHDGAAVEVGRYVKKASERKAAFAAACAIWIEAAQQLLCV